MGESPGLWSMGEGRQQPEALVIPWGQMSHKKPGTLGCSQSGRGLAPWMGTFLKERAGSHRKFSALGLCWSKQALSLQGHKALTVQEQSFQGGGNILTSVPQRQGSDWPSPHPCIPGWTTFISISEAPSPREEGEDLEGPWIPGIAFAERA